MAKKSLGKWFRASARNALEIARFGRLGEEYSASFDIVDQGANHRLRRYVTEGEGGDSAQAPIALLIPPLMVTADVYDIAPDVSAVSALASRGVQPWVVDFGAPEHESGGMHRSLDDHVRAVVQCVKRVRELTGRHVHLCGYSQGGMFAYQTAAYLRNEGIRSLITFGSPVDLHKNLPAVRSDLTGALVRSLSPITKAVLDRIEGLPGKVTSTAFKLVSTRKELEQRLDFLRTLHDRDRIKKREARRRFLGGGGFVAWPGPAFRAFVEDFVVHNRMVSGGFVIDGRTVSLADLSCPILAFIGGTDEIARPPTIRAIVDAAPNADVRFMTVRAGHFGIVVGSRAMSLTWPAVAEWILAIEGGASAADALPLPEPESDTITIDDDMEPSDLDVEIDLFVDVIGRAAKNTWRRLGESVASATDTADAVRWQEPRLRRLARIEPETRISPSLELAKRAAESPESTFFLWHDRAFSYGDADRRVTNVARGLYARGVRKGDRVGLVMESRPSLLSASTALSRLGAISVIAPPLVHAAALRDPFTELNVRRVIVDPERASSLASSSSSALLGGVEVLVLGGGARRVINTEHVIDLEAIDLNAAVLPSDLPLDGGCARDVSSILLRPSEDANRLRPVAVTNHRWALSAIGAAAACAIKPRDTVFCAVPLHHPTGILVSVGSAIAGGARLALASSSTPPIDPKELIVEIRRVGATVVFYTGEMLRPLLEEPIARADRHLPVRIFAGSGMRPDLARRIRERFGVDTMEFYAGTTHRAILADPAGTEPGSLGGILPGSAQVAIVRCDLASRSLVRSAESHLVLADVDEPGLLAVLLSDDDNEKSSSRGVIANAFGDGATWLVTSDVIKRDARGKHWFVDSLTSFVRMPPPDGSTSGSRSVSLRKVEDALFRVPEIRMCAAWEMSEGKIAAAFTCILHTSHALDALLALSPHERPAVVLRVDEIPLMEGFRPNRRLLASRAMSEADERWLLVGDRYEAASGKLSSLEDLTAPHTNEV